MEPVDFPQSNILFGPPKGLTEHQVRSIPAHTGIIPGPNPCEGLRFTVVCWQPTAEDIELIKQGAPIYISQIGALAPHFLTTKPEEAMYQA